MIRIDKTLSELWYLKENGNEYTSDVAHMALNAIKKLQEENEHYERKHENTGAIFNRQHMQGKIERYEKALKEIERWDSMLYSSRELGNFAKKALGLPTIPLKD